MADSDFMLTAEERRQKQLRRRRLIIFTGVIVLLVVIGFFGGRPALNAIKAWQARRHASKAFANIEKQDWMAARNEATAAYQIRPTEPQAIRAVARLLSRIRQADALQFWQELEKIAPLTREDQQDEAAIAILAGETSRAEVAVNALLAADAGDPAALLLAAQLSIQKGAADDAIFALRKIFGDSRATEQQQLQAAMLELSLASGTEDDRLKEAWSRIETISQGKSAVALDALVVLARRELSTPASTFQSLSNASPAPTSTTDDLVRRLETHPLSKAPQKVLALDLLEHRDPSRRDELIAQGITQLKDGDGGDLFTLAVWLDSKNEFQKTLDSVPLAKAAQSRELFLQYLDTLGGLERWSEIKQLLDAGSYPLDPVVQKMYLARCNAQLGEKTAAENNWQRAIEATGGDTGKLITVAEYAEKNGVIDVAQSAFDAAAIESPKLRIAQQGRLRIAQRSGDVKKIHGVLADMLKIWPNDMAVQNDEAYTRLLLMQQSRRGLEIEDRRSSQTLPSPDSQLPTSADAELDQIAQLAAHLVEKNPRSLPHRTLLALARLKQNRAADALEVYANINPTRSALTPSALAVHSAVLSANGKVNEAKEEASQIKAEQLLPEERALLPTK